MPRKTTPAARLKALVDSLTAGLSADGAPLTEDEAAFVRLAAANIMAGDLITEAMGRGETADSAELVRLTNTAQRVMRELREERARRTAAAPTSGMTPLQQLVANFRPAAAPIDDDEDVELPPAVAEYVASKAAQRVQTPSDEHEPAYGSVVTPQPAPKPAGKTIEVYLDSRPRTAEDPQGRTLVDVVADLHATAPGAKIKFTGPGFSRDDMTIERLAAELGPNPWLLKGAERVIGRRDWFIKGIAL